MVAVSIGFQRSDDGVVDILDQCASFLGFCFHQHLAGSEDFGSSEIFTISPVSSHYWWLIPSRHNTVHVVIPKEHLPGLISHHLDLFFPKGNGPWQRA